MDSIAIPWIVFWKKLFTSYVGRSYGVVIVHGAEIGPGFMLCLQQHPNLFSFDLDWTALGLALDLFSKMKIKMASALASF
jgi:hypothetical protein